MTTLVEASFYVARQVIEISEQVGVPVRVDGMHSIVERDDGKCSIYLDLNGGDGTLIVEVDEREVIGVDPRTIYAALTGAHDVRH